MASREEIERGARDRVAGRIYREMQRRGTPVPYDQAFDRATRIAREDYNERRDGKPVAAADAPRDSMPEGIKVRERAVTAKQMKGRRKK